jgi:fatty acid desaturase
VSPGAVVRLHMRGFRLGRRRHRRWILAELAAGALWVFLVFALSGSFALWYHVAVMAVGQSMTSFFAVWTVHHDCDRSHQIARTLRGKVKNRISFEMFFHLEHHLFPKVLTCHLPRLAERLDSAAPELQAHQVF